MTADDEGLAFAVENGKTLHCCLTCCFLREGLHSLKKLSPNWIQKNNLQRLKNLQTIGLTADWH
jgi:hypothetical protein